MTVIRPVRRPLIEIPHPALVVPGDLPWDPRSGLRASDVDPIPPVFDEENDLVLSALEPRQFTLSNNLVQRWEAPSGEVFTPPTTLLSPRYDLSKLVRVRTLWDGTNGSKLVTNKPVADSNFLHDGTTSYTLMVVWNWEPGGGTGVQHLVSTSHSESSPGIAVYLGSPAAGGAYFRVHIMGTPGSLVYADTLTMPAHPYQSSSREGPHVAVFRMNASTQTFSLRVGGADPEGELPWTNAPNPVASSRPLTLANRGDLTTSAAALKGGIGAFSIAKRYFDDKECEDVEAWAANQFGALIF